MYSYDTIEKHICRNYLLLTFNGVATLNWIAFNGHSAGRVARVGLKFGAQVALIRPLICQSFSPIGYLEGLKNLIFGCNFQQKSSM